MKLDRYTTELLENRRVVHTRRVSAKHAENEVDKEIKETLNYRIYYEYHIFQASIKQSYDRGGEKGGMKG